MFDKPTITIKYVSLTVNNYTSIHLITSNTDASANM